MKDYEGMKSAKRFLENVWTRINADKRGKDLSACARAHPRPIILIAAVIVLLIVALIGCQAVSGGSSNDVWTGFLEGTTVDVSAQVGGRVTNVAVEEGDSVHAGQLLATIADDLARQQWDAADANVAAAQAQLALLEAGARPEDLQRAQARVDQARAALVAATQAVTDTEAIRANPQALLIAQADAAARVQAAQAALTAAALQAQAADLPHQFWQDQVQSLQEGIDIRLPGGGKLHFDIPSSRIDAARTQWDQAGNNAWQAWIAVAQAQANLDTAQAALKSVSDQLTNPIALDSRVDQARAARDRAAADLQAAEAALQALREGASPAQVQAARAALDQARAARAVAAEELTHYRIIAPQEGTVSQVFYRAGEVVAPNVPLVRLSVDGELTLRVFVPTSTLPKIHIGQTVPVWVAELNNKSVEGQVARIADTAEFTSRQAQTDSERNALLIAVQVTVRSPDGQLKPGMPASVSFTQPAPSPNPSFEILSSSNSLTLSGTLEAKQTRISSEVDGLVKAVHVDKGDSIDAGAPLIEIDNTQIQTSLQQAAAAVQAAQANLDQVTEPARPGQVAVAEAAVAQANAELQAAKAALDDANRALAAKQDPSSQAQIWEGKARAAQADVSRADAALALLNDQIAVAQRDLSQAGKIQLGVLQRQQQAAQATRDAAQATLEGSQRVVALYGQILNNPLELIAAQHAAEGQVQTAQAGLKVAQAELEIVRRAPQAEAVALAQARLRAAQANLGLVQAQANRFAIASPASGTIVDRSVEVGETVRPGSPLLTLADTRELELTVFVPLHSLGALHVGQAVVVRLPSLPGKTFTGKVTFIAPESEFKPANLYNSQERSELVFQARVSVPNPTGELKAGLPADAIPNP
jgi:multidrug resistance efflux pump